MWRGSAGGVGNTQCVLLLSVAEKKGAYPTNVVDLLAVACKATVLAGNQNCSRCREPVKCVTCQGSLLGFLYRGLLNKGHILGARPSVALTKEELNTFICCPRAFILILLFLRGNDKQSGGRSVCVDVCV